MSLITNECPYFISKGNPGSAVTFKGKSMSVVVEILRRGAPSVSIQPIKTKVQ